MRHAGLAVIALAVLLLAAAVAPSGGKVTPVPAPQVVPVRADPPGSPRTLRPLTARQRRQANRIITRDARFKQIVGPGHKLGRQIPWGTEDLRKGRQREVFIGTRSEAVLATPRASLVATFRLIDYPRVKRPAYRVQRLDLTVNGLRSVVLLVDLKRRKLAGISPERADEVIPPPGYQPPPPSPH